MKQYFNSSVYIVSTVIGLISYIISLLILGLFEANSLYALLIAAIVTLISSIALPLSFYLEDSRYKDADDFVEGNILLKTNVNIKFGNVTRNGYFYLTDDSIFLISRDKKPYICHKIEKSIVEGIKVFSYVYFCILINDREKIDIATPKCEDILQLMRNNGWSVN